MPLPYAAVLFDLDGTLLDTLRDLAEAGNCALAGHGFPAHTIDAYRYFIGEGVSKLFLRALPPEARNDQTIARCASVFRAAYAQGWSVHTRPYAGIPELLQTLSQRGLPLTVLSNKPDDFTQRCVRELLGAYHFHAVLGQRHGLPLKPDPAGALEIAKRLAVPADRMLYLGDSGVDMQTATAAGMFPVGASWGFRTREELLTHGARVVISQPQDLVPLLD